MQKFPSGAIVALKYAPDRQYQVVSAINNYDPDSHHYDSRLSTNKEMWHYTLERSGDVCYWYEHHLIAA